MHYKTEAFWKNRDGKYDYVFFSRACDTKEMFRALSIAQVEEYEKYRNQYAVISISFNDVAGDCTTYADYISRIEKKLVRDLKRAYLLYYQVFVGMLEKPLTQGRELKWLGGFMESLKN